jgi:predicted DNA-binding protein YlxM (UPF0122 family)
MTDRLVTCEMLRLYESGMTLQAIADRFEITKQAVHERLKRVGYPARPTSLPPTRFDRETLVDLYVKQDLSAQEVAIRLNTHLEKIFEELKRHRIKPRRRGPRGKYHRYLSKLEIGGSVLVPWPFKSNPHSPLRDAARRLGLKISIKNTGNGPLVTRTE